MATTMTALGKSRLRFGPYEVDLNTREVWKSGIRVKVGGQPFEILVALLENPGQLVTRDQLRKRIWSEDTFVDFGHGLNAAVNKLREALCDSADEPRYIETLPRRGYRFIATTEQCASVTSITAPPETALPQQPTILASQPDWKHSLADEEWESTVPIKRSTLVQASALVSAVVLLALGSVGIWSRWWSSPSMEESESRLKEVVGPLSHEAAERSLKQLTERAEPFKRSSPRPEHPEQARKLTAESGEPEDSAILAFARSGIRPEFPQQQSSSDGPAIFRLDFPRAREAKAPIRIVAGREAIAGPQPSPDGSKLVFTAGKNYAMDIWVCNADGSSPHKLTNTGKTGTPRWSPDGRWIAFDSDGRFGRSGIYVVSVDGGPIRPLVENTFNNSVPSWSRDGKYIYFASNSGTLWEGDQVWRIPAEGGRPLQITRNGGFSAYESVDGQWLYYAKSRQQNPEIWQVPVHGGEESKLSLLHPSTWASWALTNKGILLLSEFRGQASELQYFDFATRSVHSLATLEKASFWLSASAKGTSIWYSELTDSQANQVFKAGMD